MSRVTEILANLSEGGSGVIPQTLRETTMLLWRSGYVGSTDWSTWPPGPWQARHSILPHQDAETTGQVQSLQVSEELKEV
jgi:hypothetical protein